MSCNVEWDYGETTDEKRTRRRREKGERKRNTPTSRSKIKEERKKIEDQSAEMRGYLHRYWNWVL